MPCLVRLVCIAWCCAALGACAGQSPIPLPGQPEASFPAAYDVYDYYLWLDTASAEALSSEEQRLLALQGEEQVVVSVQLALLYSLSGISDLQMEAEALRLLENLNDAGLLWYDNRGRHYLRFAEIWKDVLRTRRALRQRPDYNDEVERLRLRNRELERQIDALTDIEQQLIERERPKRP